MIDYYSELESVDKELIEINKWQEEELKKLYAETEKKINKALAKLGTQVPEGVKNGYRK